MAYSSGFSPHPKICYVGAAPTGVASEAEYLEIGLARECDPERVRVALDAALPPGLDILEAVTAGPGSLAERMEATPGRSTSPAWRSSSRRAFAPPRREEFSVERLTKNGRRTSTCARPLGGAEGAAATARRGGRAILDVVVRQVTPAVRPDDVLAALRTVAGLAPAAPPLAVRQAQGPLDERGTVGDPLDADRTTPATAS